MLSATKDQLIEKLSSKSGKSIAELDGFVKKKLAELKGLISEEGAVYIISSELGIDLLDTEKKSVEIKDLLAGMKNLELTGTVAAVFEVKEFEYHGKKGKVGAFMLADKTGSVRIVLWDEKTKQLEKLSKGTAVLVKNVLIKKSKFAGYEAHLGKWSAIEELPKDQAIELPKISAAMKATEVLGLSNLNPGTRISARGTVVQVYPPGFYSVCPTCNKSIAENKCPEHGAVSPEPQMVFSLMLDDGTTCVRCVAFRETAAELAQHSPKDAKKQISENSETMFHEKLETELLGKEIRVAGLVRYNNSFNRTEIIINKCDLALAPLQIISELESE